MRNFCGSEIRVGTVSTSSPELVPSVEGPIFGATIWPPGPAMNIQNPGVLPQDYWAFLADGGKGIIGIGTAKAAAEAGYPLDNLWVPVHPYLFKNQIWFLELVPASDVVD